MSHNVLHQWQTRKENKTEFHGSAAAQAPYLLAIGSIDQGDYDAAEKHLEASLNQEKTGQACRALAIIRLVRDDPDGAAAQLEEALDINTQDDAALSMMAEILVDAGDIQQALGYHMLAIKTNPDNIFCKERFIQLASGAAFYKYNPHVEEILLACLDTAGIDCARASQLWLNVLKLNPGFVPLYKHANQGNRVTFNKKAFARQQDYAALSSSYFLTGLKKLTVHNLVFEEFLTTLRQNLLDDSDACDKFPADQQLAIASALAHYCFNTEYIFETTPDEQAQVEGLKGRLETTEPDERRLALYACYAPLYSLKNAAQIVKTAGFSPAFKEIIRLQIEEPETLKKIAATIPALTKIEDAVSGKVREQYEESPYPKWTSYSKTPYDEIIESRFLDKPISILSAGCGTGKDPIELGTSFPMAAVTAVDLSRNSLAYAQNRAQTLGVTNIKFGQADILKLDGLGQSFDYISCGGVLHHMKEPLDGWRVLTNILKPGGLMKIGLYSAPARRLITQARDAALQKNYPATYEGMTKFRKDSREFLNREIQDNISAFGDYYYTSMYRDLIFHVQEHRYDILKIKEQLGQLGLTFIKFHQTPFIENQYQDKFPNDPKATNLDNWHAFEQENSDTFKNMYVFWCEKPFINK